MHQSPKRIGGSRIRPRKSNEEWWSAPRSFISNHVHIFRMRHIVSGIGPKAMVQTRLQQHTPYVM